MCAGETSNTPPKADKAAPAASTDNCEEQMAVLLRAGNVEGMNALLRTATTVNVRMVNMVLSAELESGCPIERAAVNMLQTCRSRNLAPSAALYNNVLGALSKRAPPEQVLAWLARMRDSSLIDVIACNIQLKAHLTLNDFSNATKLLSEMLRGETGLPAPDSVSFNTVIAALAQARQPAKAEALLNTMLDTGRVADTVAFTAVISGFARASQPSKAAKWLQRMIEAKVLPDTVAFNAVLAAYANASDADGARRVLQAFEEHAAADCPIARPDLVSYNTMLSACAKAQKPLEAEKVFQTLVDAGLHPNLVTFSTVLSAHARAGDPGRAQAWLDRMLAHGIAPDAVSYNTVCSAHARIGNVSAALETFHRMEAARVPTSATTHAIMINALVQADQLDHAENVLRQLLAQRVTLSASAFNSIISAHAKAGRPARAEATLAFMREARVSPSVVSFNALASAHSAQGNLQAVEAVLEQAVAQRLPLDRFSYGALLQACINAKGGNKATARERAKQHVQSLLYSGVELNDYLRTMCRRAIGEQAFTALLNERATRSSSGNRFLQHRAGSSASDAAAGGTLITSAASAAQQPKDGRRRSGRNRRGQTQDDDGWTTSGSRSSRATVETVPSPSAGIKKKNPQLPAKTHTATPSLKSPKVAGAAGVALGALGASPGASPNNVRLAGVPMTRSKSERSRLLALAQGAMQGVAGEHPVAIPVPEDSAMVTDAPSAARPPTVQRPQSASVLPEVEVTPASSSLSPLQSTRLGSARFGLSPLPLKRSAASELESICCAGLGGSLDNTGNPAGVFAITVPAPAAAAAVAAPAAAAPARRLKSAGKPPGLPIREGIPLTRSAASELAICLGDGMML